MGFMTINKKKSQFTDEKDVLSVIRKAGIDIPTFCYHSELSTRRMPSLCGRGRQGGKSLCFLFGEAKRRNGDIHKYAGCSITAKTIIELLLAAHNRECTTCMPNGILRPSGTFKTPGR